MLYSKFYERLYSFRVKTAKTASEFFNFLPNRFYLGGIILIQALTWWLSYSIFKGIADSLLVLHYNINFGINWIGDGYLIFYFPLLSLVFLLVAIFLIFIFGVGRHFRMQSHYLMLGTLMSSLGILLAVFLIYLINFK